jgi:hypothetical protein
MGRVVQPGGESGKIRVRYTARRKYGLLSAARCMRTGGKSLQGIAEELKVSHSFLSRWEAQKISEMDPRNKLFKSKKKESHTGLLGQLEVIKEPLLSYVFKLCKQGIVVNTFKVALRASFILPEFRKKLFTVQCSAVKRWLVAHSMRYPMGTHTVQRPPAEVKCKALDYMNYMHRIVLGSSNCNRHFLLNMDQTPVYFLMNTKCTLELIRKRRSTFAPQPTIQSVRPWLLVVSSIH